MQEILLEAEIRKDVGGNTKAMRREGKVPGIFYIHGEKNIPVIVPERSLKPLIFTSETHIINLKLNDGTGKECILRDIQFDPLTDRPIHFDLQGVRADEEITVEIPVTLTGGTPVGVRDGGILQQVIHRLKISCLPKDIPEHIEVHVEDLKINHFVHIRDIKIPNITILGNEDSSVAGVVPPTIEKEPEPGVVAEEAAEPEVIAKGKKPEEGAEAAPAAAAGEKKPEAAPGKAAPAAKPAPAKEEKK
ncbi:MAG TPA: 50S ribosomal protein L25 [Bacteroidota bacterium]|nr:50S ribosomal protein L25 [Bacteroidota bacterium]